MRYLMLIHVGPVQEFIVTARSSRDLWFGSWLLSELSKAAAGALIAGRPDNRLIFPAVDDLDDLKPASEFDVANKVLVLVDTDPGAIRELGESARAAVSDRLQSLYSEAASHIHGPLTDRVAATAQVEDMIELFWAALPLNEPEGYSQTRSRLESLMAARKATRSFIPTDAWKGKVPKSSLDGQRESVIPESAYSTTGLTPEQREDRLQLLRARYGVRHGERLCAVGLFKRHGQRGGVNSFLSTSHMASLPLITRLQPEHRSAVEKYAEDLKQLGADVSLVSGQSHPVFGPFDGEILFEGRLQELLGGDSGNNVSARHSLSEFLRTTVEGHRPLPYYALLHGDGDGMGRTIDALLDPDSHRALSLALAGFARRVREIVPRHHGSLVYAGGDDVLAFVPIHTVLECARELSECFHQALAPFGIEEAGRKYTPTLSVGIAVAHHLDPLSDALQMARAAEKRAKSIRGKNALAVTVSKRSGADRTVAGRWGDLDRRLDRFIALHRADAIPDGAAYELQDLARRLNLTDTVESSPLKEAARFEAIRILGRKRAGRGSESIAQDTLKELEGYLREKSTDLGRIAEEIIVARVFADAKELARLTRSDEQ